MKINLNGMKFGYGYKFQLVAENNGEEAILQACAENRGTMKLQGKARSTGYEWAEVIFPVSNGEK